MKIPITFLGTSQAIPTKDRNHSSILLKYKDENILIDCGEGTQRQFRIAKINPCKLTRILITHWHGDHVLGLPGLFQTLALSNFSKKLYIYGPKKTKTFTKQLIKPFIPVLKFKAEVKEVKNKVFENKDFKITSRALSHGVPCVGYSFKEKDKLKIKKSKLPKIPNKQKYKLKQLSEEKDIKINNKTLKAKDYTYKKKGKKISFIFDTKYCKNAINLTKDSDLLIAESTYSNKEKKLAKEYKHLTAEQAAKIAKKANAKKLILTHISQRYKNPKILLKQAKKIFKNTKIAEDFMKVEV